MLTTTKFAFPLVTTRSRAMVIFASLSLLLGFALWNLAPDTKATAASPVPQGADFGFLYVLNACNGCPNQIFGFAVDETTGALTPLANFPISTGGTGKSNFTSELLTIDRKNLRLFVINDGSNTVSAYTIDLTTGALTTLSFSPVGLPLPAINPAAPHWSTLAVHPSGSDSLLVVGDTGLTVGGGLLASFKITATTATPVSTLGTGLANPLSAAFSQDGAFVYTGGGTSTKIAGFSIDANAVLTPLNGSPFEPFKQNPSAYATDAAGRLFVASRPFSELLVFTTTNGIPSASPVNSPSPSGAGHAGHGVLHPNGFYLVSGRLGDKVSVDKINTPAGATTLTRVPGSPFTSGGAGVNLLALNHAGSFLYAGNSDTHNLTTFSVDAAGALAIRVTQPVNTLCTQGGPPCSSGRLDGIAYLPPRRTTTTINAPEITCGQDGTVIVKVSSPAGSPTGNVTLTVDGGAPLTQPLIGDSATFTIPGLTAVNHTLVATFAAQNGFPASSATATLVVKLAPTTMTIDAAAIACGADGSVVVTVTSPFGTPSGEVTLTVDGGAAITRTLSGGVATFPIPAPNAGSHTLVANFAAQGCFASRSANSTLVVNLLPTTTTIVAPAITFGQEASIGVTVTSPGGTPVGNVSLTVDGGPEMTRPLIGSSATFPVPGLTVGDHALVATFTAQGCFDVSSDPDTLVVKIARTGTLIIAPPIVFGLNGIVSVTVAAQFTTPSGNVSLSVDGGAATTKALSGGVAIFTINTPAVGDHALSARFPEQGGFTASSDTEVLTVKKAQSTKTRISPLIVTLGFPSIVQTAPITVTVDSLFFGTPKGNVSLTLDNGTAIIRPLSNGSATFNLVLPKAGIHFLQAKFLGEPGVFAPSGVTRLFVVKGAAPPKTTPTVSAQVIRLKPPLRSPSIWTQ